MEAIATSSIPQAHSCLVFLVWASNCIIQSLCIFVNVFWGNILLHVYFSSESFWCIGLVFFFLPKCISKNISIHSLLPRTLVCTSWDQAACRSSCRLCSQTITLFSSSSIMSTFSESGLHTAFSETRLTPGY